MSKPYYDPEDLKKFGDITEFSETLGKKFFEWYGAVFQEGALSQREKSLIALAVAHAIQCAYCIDAYTTGSLEKGANEAQMMEAVHVAAAIRGGSSLVHAVQMMNKVKSLAM
jgi:alkylhydroperoxidase/carboxymuconolactone decarboxylase family protein